MITIANINDVDVKKYDEVWVIMRSEKSAK